MDPEKLSGLQQVCLQVDFKGFGVYFLWCCGLLFPDIELL